MTLDGYSNLDRMKVNRQLKTRFQFHASLTYNLNGSLMPAKFITEIAI